MTATVQQDLSAQLSGAVEGDQFEVRRNSDGTKTMSYALAPKSVATGREPNRKISTTIGLETGGGGRAQLREPISFGGSSDAGELLAVGEKGSRLVFGRPNFSGVEKTAAGKVQKETRRGVKAGEKPGKEGQAKKRASGKRSNETSYGAVFGDTSELVYEVFTDGVKESIVLKEAPAIDSPPVFRFPFSAEGLKRQISKDGRLEFVDASETVRFSIPPAFMFDSRGGANTPGNAHIGVPMEVVEDAEGSVLVLRPSAAWLADPSRVYPVVIDPTVNLMPWNPMNLANMPFGNNAGTTSFSTWTNDLQFGNWWGSNWRSYMQFDPSLFVGKTILNAKLKLQVSSCDNQTNPSAPYAVPIGVHNLTSGYYFGQQWPGPGWNGEVWAQATGPGSVAIADITQMAIAWGANPTTNFGVMLDTGSAQGYCRVQRSTSGGLATEVEVTYNDAPSTVQEYGLLKNFSFENGNADYWKPCSRASSATFGVVTGSTPSGLKHAQLRTNDASPVSICQTVVTPVGPGKRYSLIVSVRSASGAPISGAISLLEDGANPAAVTKPFTTSGTAWMNVQLIMDGVNSNNFGLQSDVFVNSPNAASLDIDYVVISSTNQPGVTLPPVNTNAPGTVTTTTVAPSPPPAPAVSNALVGTAKLVQNQFIQSANGRFRAQMQPDGNFVVYDTQTSCNGGWCDVWSSNTAGNPGSVLYMQNDGNLVVYRYDNPPTVPIWDSKSNGSSANKVTLENDGSLVVSAPSGVKIWGTSAGSIPQPGSGPAGSVTVTITPVGVTVTPLPTGTSSTRGPWPLLNEFIPGQIHDPNYLQCLSDTGSSLGLATASKDQCNYFIPKLVGSPAPGHILYTDEALATCLTRVGNGVAASPCTNNANQVFADVLISGYVDRFTLSNGGQCLTRPIGFAACNGGDPAQQWADASCGDTWNRLACSLASTLVNATVDVTKAGARYTWSVARSLSNTPFTVAGLAFAEYKKRPGYGCTMRTGLIQECFVTDFGGGLQATIGNVVINRDVAAGIPVSMSSAVLSHETKHADQWATLKLLMLPLLAEYAVYPTGRQCTFIDWWASFSKGGYTDCKNSFWSKHLGYT